MNANFKMRMAMGCSILVAVCQSAALAGGMGGHVGGGNSGGSAFHSSNFSAVHSMPVQKVQSLNTDSYKLQNNVSHVTPNYSSSTALKLVTTKQLNSGTVTPVKLPTTGIFQPAGGTTTNPTGGRKSPITGITKVPVNVGVLQPIGGTTTNPTGGGKSPITGITKVPVNVGILQPIGGTTTNPTGGTPPSGGTPPIGGNIPTCGPTCPTGGNCNPGQNCGSNWLWSNPGFFGNWGYGNGYGGSYSATPVVYNNVTTSSPAVVDAVAPVQSPANKMTLKLGQSYTIVNDSFGEKSGDLSLAISGLTLPVRVDNWDAQQITFTVPFVGLDKATDGMFQIAGADHNLNKAVPVTVVAAR